MKKINILFWATLFALPVFAQTISTFENLTLAADTFWNGSDLSGGFASGNTHFLNDYDTTYYAWSGFAYSNKKDTVTAGYLNQYSAITGGGYNASANYAIADEFGNAKIKLTGNATGKPVTGFFITNTTYAYLSMKNGDQFAKKFGGVSGADKDWFLLTAKGWLNGIEKNNTVDFYLADFRSADSTQHYILNNWTWLNLLPLGSVDSIQFFLSSSDTAFGYMNTPAYFAMDNFTTSDQQNIAPVTVDDYITTSYLHDTLIDVLANDFDTTFLPLAIQITAGPIISGATATVTNNKIYYVPAVGIVSDDTLTYQLCDATLTCASAKLVINVISINSTDEISENLKYTIYPNPFTEQITIYHSEFSIGEQCSVSVFDNTGKEIYSSVFANSALQISTENWSTGIYFLKLTTHENSLTKKIIKQ